MDTSAFPVDRTHTNEEDGSVKGRGWYSTIPGNGNRVDGSHLGICLSSSQKNRNSRTWVLVALTVCFTYPDSLAHTDNSHRE